METSSQNDRGSEAAEGLCARAEEGSEVGLKQARPSKKKKREAKVLLQAAKEKAYELAVMAVEHHTRGANPRRYEETVVNLPSKVKMVLDKLCVDSTKLPSLVEEIAELLAREGQTARAP